MGFSFQFSIYCLKMYSFGFLLVSLNVQTCPSMPIQGSYNNIYTKLTDPKTKATSSVFLF